MRTIKFRGRDFAGIWWYGYPSLHEGNPVIHPLQCTAASMFVDEDTVGQFTDLYDKNGKEIYEGDIIKWYEIGHSDHDVLEPPEDYIKECMDVVQFIGGTFCVEREEAPSVMPVEFLTKEFQYNEDDIFKWVDNTDEYPNITVDDMYICEVLGNIHDNPELINKPTND